MIESFDFTINATGRTFMIDQVAEVCAPFGQ
jgi:hypothetical protein